MERNMRGRSHGVASHYSLSRPEFEVQSSDHGDGDRVFGQSMQYRRLSEFNEGLPRGNPTSSKFEWQKLFAQPKELGNAGNHGTTDSTLINDGNGRFSNPSQIGLPNMPISMEPERGMFSGPRDSGIVITDGIEIFSNSSQFGTTLPEIPSSVEPEIGRFSGRTGKPCHQEVGVPQHSCNSFGCNNALSSRIMTRGSQMDEEFTSQKTQKRGQLNNLEVYFKAASVYTELGSQLKEFEMAFQKDAIHGSFKKGLHVPSSGSGLGTQCVDLCGLDVRSIESHVDPHSMRSSDMKGNPLVDPLNIRSSDMKSNPLVGLCSMQSSDRRISPLGDSSSEEEKHVDYTCTDQKMARGGICKMYDKFYRNMAGLEEHAGPGLVRASNGNQTADRIDECSPRVHLKSTKLGDHVSPSKQQSNAHYVTASGSLHSKVQEREVRGHGSTLLKDQDAYKKHGHLLLANEHGLERERLEMLPIIGHNACLDGADGKFEQQIERERLEFLPVIKSDSCYEKVDSSLEQHQLPTGDSFGNLMKRKDGNCESQQTAEDEHHPIVSKKSRHSLLQDENVAKTSNETDCQMTANYDNHVSQLVKSRGMDSGDINKCLESSPRKIIATKSSHSKQSPPVEKRLKSSPQKIGATHSSVNSPNHSITKQLGPAPEIVIPCETVLQNQNGVIFTKRLGDDPDGQDDSDGDHDQEGDSLEDNSSLKKTEQHHISPPQVKNQIARKFTKRSQDDPNDGHNQVVDSSKSNTTPTKSKPRVNFSKGSTRVKTKPPHFPPRSAEKKKVGKFSERFRDGPDGTRSQGADLNGVHLEKGDSLDGNVTLAKTVPLEDSKDFKQRVHSAFLKFVKQLNESAQRRNFMEQGKAGDLKCNVCGSKSEEFEDMKSLVRHTFTSPTVDHRALHLGFHKALCLMMGWKSARLFDSSWICEILPGAEASALKEDLIIWPPVVIIRNSSIQNNNPDERVVVTTESVEAVLKDMGFGEKIKVSWGRPGDESVILAKFSGTLSGFQEAERLHSFYVEKKHGRVEYQHFAYGKSSITRDSNLLAVESILYGYIGLAEDSEKLDLQTKNRCFVKSKKDIQNIADAF